MTSLKGVVEEWDSSDCVRTRMRNHHRLILPAADKDEAKADVECGEYNFEALRPLVKRLRDPKGNVSMHTVPDLMRENFG